MMNKLELSIIIVAYKKPEVLARCLASIPQRADWEVIAVDNSEENRGFAKGCNLGAGRAKGEVLFFLNPDTQVTEVSIERLMETLEGDESIGIVAPQLVDETSKAYLSYSQQPTVGTSWVVYSVLNTLFWWTKLVREHWMVGNQVSGFRFQVTAKGREEEKKRMSEEGERDREGRGNRAEQDKQDKQDKQDASMELDSDKLKVLADSSKFKTKNLKLKTMNLNLYKDPLSLWEVPSETIEVGIVSGAALMMRRADYISLGGFDERFFMYWEEVDLCRRCLGLGKKVVYQSTAEIMHSGGLLTPPKSKQVKQWFRESRRWFFTKHFGWLTGRLIQTWLVGQEEWRLVLSLAFGLIGLFKLLN